MTKSKIVGKTIKNWFVNELVREEPYGTPDGRIRRFYKCICKCGVQAILDSDSLSHKFGKRSCGCIPKANTTTGAKLITQYLFNQYRNGANQRNLLFQLSKEQVFMFSQEPCFYCGILPSNKYIDRQSYGRDTTYNGIDRVDNKQGYITGNCVTCCKICNYAKNTMSQQEFLDWVKRIYTYSIKEKQLGTSA